MVQVSWDIDQEVYSIKTSVTATVNLKEKETTSDQPAGENTSSETSENTNEDSENTDEEDNGTTGNKNGSSGSNTN